MSTTVRLVNIVLSQVISARYQAGITLRLSGLSYEANRDRMSRKKVHGDLFYMSVKDITRPINIEKLRKDIVEEYNFLLKSFEDKYHEVESIRMILCSSN